LLCRGGDTHLCPALWREAVDIEHAIQVVVLVLEDAGLPVLELLRLLLPPHILELDLDPHRSLDLSTDVIGAITRSVREYAATTQVWYIWAI
jgi:hypothetical protein